MVRMGSNHAEVRHRADAAGAGELTDDQLREISAASNKVIRGLRPDLRWLDQLRHRRQALLRLRGADEDIIYEHARCGGFPADSVKRCHRVIDPVHDAG